jgi:hypothetical protein
MSVRSASAVSPGVRGSNSAGSAYSTSARRDALAGYPLDFAGAATVFVLAFALAFGLAFTTLYEAAMLRTIYVKL